MTIDVRREPTVDGVTFGVLSIDGVPVASTLEDAVREHKLAGETCIPAGRYKVVITKSQRFGKMLPLLLDVPEFTGVRIHAGNTTADTQGCILVGLQRHAKTIIQSRSALEVVQGRIATALAGGQSVWMEIHNAPLHAGPQTLSA